MGKIVDISYHQGTIDWTKASKEIDLAIIRVQYGSRIIDTKYKEYVAYCKQLNIPFGHYAYGRYLNITDAEKEANDFLSRIDKAAKFLVLDAEEVTVKDIKDLIPATQRFIDICKKAGYKVGLYSGEFFIKHYGLSQIKADFTWIAKYSSAKPVFHCELWQNTSSGSVNGINGNVDLNVLNGTKDLNWFKGIVSDPVKQESDTPAKPFTPPPPKPIGQWKKENSQWFYYENGKKRVGWLNDGGKWYYLDENSASMCVGWKQVSGKWYFFDVHGVLETNSWITDKGKKYYVNDKGQLVTGTQIIDGVSHTFDVHGALVK